MPNPEIIINLMPILVPFLFFLFLLSISIINFVIEGFKQKNEQIKIEKVKTIITKKKKTRTKQKPRGRITKDQFQQMMDFANDFCTRHKKFYTPRLRLVLLMLKMTGCRVCELLEIKIEDFLPQLKGPTPSIYLYIPKTNINRTVHVSLRERDQLLEQAEKLGFTKGYLISKYKHPDKKLNNIHWISHINKFLDKFSEKYKLSNYNLKSHSFRITLITEIEEKSNFAGGFKEASRIVGHKNLTTTQRYSRDVQYSREKSLNLRNQVDVNLTENKIS